MAKKVVGIILLVICILEFVTGIALLNEGKSMQDIPGFIPAVILFGVPAFFLLKPSKRANTANFNLPPNAQGNTTGKRAGSVVKKVFGVICAIEIFVGITLMSTAKTTEQLVGFFPVTLIFAVLAFFLLKPSKKANTANFNPPPNEQINKNVYVRSDQPAQDQAVQAQIAQVRDALAQAAEIAQAAAQAKAEQDTKQRVASIVDDIEKLNQLLYAGLITQEEFDAKKKQLLGL